MTTTDVNLFAEQIFRDAAFGLGFLAIVLVVNAILFIRIFLWFMTATAKLTKPTAFDLIFLFVLGVLMMSLVQITSILIWTAALYTTGLIGDMRSAMLFSGSSYTTLGIFSDVLPQGWKSVAFYIAFSGLFSFAIATSSMMSMLSIVAKKLYKQAAKS
jgi:hypothetical protein